MKLQTLKPRLKVASQSRIAVLDVKAGATERVRGSGWMNTRKRILQRDGYACQSCGIVRADNEVDHRIPLEQGGSNDDANLQTLCGGPEGCHAIKTANEAKARAGR